MPIDIKIPDTIIKTILFFNGVILVIFGYYSLTGAEYSTIPTPFAFVVTSLFSIFICLVAWYMQDSVIDDFEEKFGNSPNRLWHWNKDKFNDFRGRIRFTKGISIFGFAFFHFLAIIVQLANMNI
jgi:hypothetical protein